MNLEEMVRHVADLRQKLAEAKARRDELLKEFNDTHTEEIAAVVRYSEALNAAETDLRREALVAHATTGDKKPAPGIAIQQATVIEYDHRAALAWAKEHSMALALDTKAFEKLAAATPENFAFVSIRKEPKATIATDLTKALGDGANA